MAEAEKQLYILAGYDDASEEILAGFQNILYDRGFVGTHTKNIPMHITLGSFPTDREEALKALLGKLSEEVDSFEVTFNHVGIFGGAHVLFAAPDMSDELLELKEKCSDSFHWTPHTTILIDEPDVIFRAAPYVINEFKPFVGRINSLHLYEFFPTRHIMSVTLRDTALCGKVREMAQEEIPECVDVIRRSFQTVADEFGFTPENAPRFTAFATDENRLLYQYFIEKRPMCVFAHHGQIVGYYSLLIGGDGSAELNNLSVLPEFRHKGIGAKLLEDCFARVRMLGIGKLKIGIVEENEVLRKWYEQFGFVHTGTEKYDFFPFTCGYMEKTLF
ncbi:MAG: GNAT family N-acetyltransferase [Lachnospiraceae bacterium]|nr:GNAT family N-acetyltransferase [Lachnospiraceae bacterium]